MKTVFKVGMTVYDQVVFPDKEGQVINIVEKDAFPIKVYLEGIGVTHSYTKDGRVIEKISPTLSTSSYTLQGFEQKAPVPTFEKVIKEARSKGDYYYLPDCLEAPSEELVEATMALLKLLFLRDYYNEGWQPDWKNDDEYKYVILTENDKVERERNYSYRRALAFKTSEIRDKFFEEQKELLEIAKPLL